MAAAAIFGTLAGLGDLGEQQAEGRQIANQEIVRRLAAEQQKQAFQTQQQEAQLRQQELQQRLQAGKQLVPFGPIHTAPGGQQYQRMISPLTGDMSLRQLDGPGDETPEQEEFRSLEKIFGTDTAKELLQRKVLGRVASAEGKPTLKQQNDGSWWWIYPPESNLPAQRVMENGKPFIGKTPPTSVIRTGVWHYVDADNNEREVPTVSETTKVYAGAPAPQAAATALGLETPSPFRPSQQGGTIWATDQNNNPIQITPNTATNLGTGQVIPSLTPQTAPTATQPAVAAPGGTPNAAGRVIGPARLSQQERAVVQTDQQLMGNTADVMQYLEKANATSSNSVIDKLRASVAWMQYNNGFAPTDPLYGPIIKQVAAIGIQGAAPWVRIGRGKYTFETIQKHLPQPTDTPKNMYDKIKWLHDNVIPSSLESITGRSGAGTNQPKVFPGAPPVGTVEDGHKYMGGDPSDQNNWVAVPQTRR
jgi:hypothetical protein